MSNPDMDAVRESLAQQVASLQKSVALLLAACERSLRHYEAIRDPELDDTPMMNQLRIAIRSEHSRAALAKHGEAK